MPDLAKLRDLIFETDNDACFIERERILGRLEQEMRGYDAPDKYARIFSTLLSEVSTPLLDCDYFAGRVVEALPDPGMAAPNRLLHTGGHMSFDYEKVLRCGLRGILEEITANAAKKGDAASLSFAENARIVVEALRDFAGRYSVAAEKQGFSQMAKALAVVPYEPAYDFYSALQAIWLIHMVASCYVGERDYAFGRFDRYMYPFYKKALDGGASKQELSELLSGFLIKANEICGRCTHNYKQKPVLCQSSKQYVNIGGENPNEFSSMVLDAAMRANMAQPTIIVLLKPDADAAFTKNVFEALAVLTDKMNIYNYDLIVSELLRKGIEEDVAKDFTYSACCTFDLNYHTFRMEHYTPVPQIFSDVLRRGEYDSLEQLVAAFRDAVREDLQAYADRTQQGLSPEEQRRQFVLDSILLSDSATECRYAGDGNAKYNVLNLFCPGVATVGDSLMVIDKLVFKEKRYTYREFIDILQDDYKSAPQLQEEILHYTKFGNDTDADDYTVMAGKAFIEAADGLRLRKNFYAMPGFYSLERDNSWREQVAATPDGRNAGEPFSENQSPTYGADRNGITALLKSVAKLPFDRTVTGGLNLTFTKQVSAEILQALVLSYFEMGGLHVGISMIDREVLQDAMARPEKYKSLTVRLYGFSEYFVSLPQWQQLAVLNRTVYGG